MRIVNNYKRSQGSQAWGFLLLLLSVCLAFGAKAQQPKVIFVGSVDAKYNGTKVYMFNGITKQRDTTVVQEGRWQLDIPFVEATRYLLVAEAELLKEKGSYGPFGILVNKPSEIHVKGDLESFASSIVKGSPAQDLLQAYHAGINGQGDAILDSLTKAYQTDVRGLMKDPSKKEAQDILIREAYGAAVNKAIHQGIAAQVARYPEDLSAPFLLDRYSSNMQPELIARLYDQLSPEMKETSFGIRIKTSVKNAMQSKLGAQIPDFTLENDKGEKITMESLKGSYVFLDFWASWCGPCIAEFPHVKTAYEKHGKRLNFKIVGISIDKNKKAWESALAKYELPWLQLLDGQGAASVSENMLHVKSIPSTFLIDPQGRIIQKDLRGEELNKFLDNLF